MSVITPVTEDDLWTSAYYIAWVGACNPRGIQRTLDQVSEHFGAEHPAVRAIQGHLAYLNHESLGPTIDDLELVRENARRLGLDTHL